ncbi:MAG: bis(5'-nucleosyl)-tetraphosphatase (symmetrical) YqeK [Defluviitaleaceae bacterium]|nr:bis(5'-nucleosyl)-tetraphosphatase (symmetrical) YqeK [Defluviitaleaceae bacterium]
MSWKFDEITDEVKKNMSEKRFRHVLGVVQTAATLASRHGVDVTAAKLAALVHDVVKEQDFEEAKSLLIEKGETDYLAYSPKVWHAPLGASVAQEKFGIENVDVLNAIKYHTTGRAKMSQLEKVIFVADYTEPNRQFEGCMAVRAYWDQLDQAVYEILKQKVGKVSGLGLGMHPDTLAAYGYYKEKMDMSV